MIGKELEHETLSHQHAVLHTKSNSWCSKEYSD